MKKQHGFTIIEMLVAVLVVGGLGGWVANIVKFVGMNFDLFTPMLVLRAIGIIVAPLGAVLGFI